MKAELEFAFELADLAASRSLKAFRTEQFSVVRKPDGSPVTEVDHQVERDLRNRIERERPGQMIVGEETGISGRSDWCWYLDPINGTSRLIGGDPRWMTLIALAYRNEVVLGIVDLPALGERWWASQGNGAFHDDKRIRVSRTDRLSKAVINDDWHQHIASGHNDHPLALVASRCARVRPHQGHSFLAVACGDADIAISVGSHAWDYAPLKVIVEEAGGIYTDFDGGACFDTGHVGTNALLHPQVLDVLLHRSPD